VTVAGGCSCWMSRGWFSTRLLISGPQALKESLLIEHGVQAHATPDVITGCYERNGLPFIKDLNNPLSLIHRPDVTRKVLPNLAPNLSLILCRLWG
jgi:hypothetical protein